MIIRLTSKLAEKLGIALVEVLPAGTDPYLDWTARVFTVRRLQHILLTNTRTLYSVVMPGRGITTSTRLLAAMSASLEELMGQDGSGSIFGSSILLAMATAAFSKNTNRSVTGSMNDLVSLAERYILDGDLSLLDVSRKLNEAPMSYLGYESPRGALKSLAMKQETSDRTAESEGVHSRGWWTMPADGAGAKGGSGVGSPCRMSISGEPPTRQTSSEARGDKQVVRPAQHTDAAQLALLNREFNDSDVTARQIADYLADCPSHEHTVVAEVDGRLAGFGCVQIYRSWCYPEPWAELTELYVAPGHRRGGLGRAIVRFAEALAKDAGATEIVLLTGKQNTAGQSQYRSMGYVERAELAFRKDLVYSDGPHD
jgi:ribosomal protein S18 acetylase RimI-like enzyme